MKACDNCKSTDAVETTFVQVTTETRTASRHIELCRACISQLADTAELNLVELTSRGLGMASARPEIPFRDAEPMAEAVPDSPPGTNPAETEAAESQPVEPQAPKPQDAPLEPAAEHTPLIPPQTL